MNRVITYIANVHRKGTKESSKRFYGGIGFIVALVYIGLFRHDLVDELLIATTTLLASGTLAQKFENRNK